METKVPSNAKVGTQRQLPGIMETRYKAVFWIVVMPTSLFRHFYSKSGSAK